MATVHVRVLACGAVALLGAVGPAHSQHLPLTTYTTAQGLPGNDASAAVEDSLGFLWIATEHGLSRFDGRGFRNFGKEHGLADERITSLVMAGDVLWVGTRSGIYQFDFAHAAFVHVPVEGRQPRWSRTTLALDREGTLWCGADDGLYRLERDGGPPRIRHVDVPSDVSIPFVNALAADADGNVWIASEHLYRRSREGRVQRLDAHNSLSSGVSFLSVDRDGRLAVSANSGLWIIEACGNQALEACRVRHALAFEVMPWSGPVWKSDGGFWIGTSAGLLEIDRTGRVQRRVSREHGLLGDPIPIRLDRHGDLWLGISLTALQRLAADGLTAFGDAEGLEAGLVNSILTTRNDELVVIGHPHVVQTLQGRRFTVTRPLMPATVSAPGWGWYQIDLQDRFGEWWISTNNGIAHWPAVRSPEDLARTPAIDVLAWRGCFRGQEIFRLYEDSHGDLWIGTIEVGRPALHRWNRSTGTIECFSTTSFLEKETAPTAFLDDGAGALWIGFYQGQIARYRDGTIVCLVDCVNASQGNITSMMLDHRRRLWISTNNAGVLRLENLASDHPSVVRFTTHNGLTSNRTRAVLEDRFSRIYIGTDQGIDVLAPNDTRIRHYGVDDGLPHPFINMAQSDPHGTLWFGTLDGVAELKPTAPTPLSAPPQVLIDGIRVAGVPRLIAATGAPEIDNVVLAPDQRNIEVDFVAMPRELSRTAGFEYRLADAEEWSPAGANRSIVLAGLSAGSHRLQIRTLAAGGDTSRPIATLRFRVLAPVYQRGWFVISSALTLCGLLWLAYRSRVAHITALERQRTLIAMDLHDEMGSKLGSIGLLADLAAEEAAPATPQRSRLEQIAETAAEMGSALADIVWSLRRGDMTLEAVVQHVAIHGRRLFPGSTPAFEMRCPDPWPEVHVSPGVGRAVMLIALEALHNCARHAKARSVTLDIHADGANWVLTVADNGVGMSAGTDPSAPDAGFGLHTLQQRAADIGGLLAVESRPGVGTVVALTFNPRATDRFEHRMNIRGIRRRRRAMS